jgi:hypothetical protein
MLNSDQPYLNPALTDSILQDLKLAGIGIKNLNHIQLMDILEAKRAYLANLRSLCIPVITYTQLSLPPQSILISELLSRFVDESTVRLIFINAHPKYLQFISNLISKLDPTYFLEVIIDGPIKPAQQQKINIANLISQKKGDMKFEKDDLYNCALYLSELMVGSFKNTFNNDLMSQGKREKLFSHLEEMLDLFSFQQGVTESRDEIIAHCFNTIIFVYTYIVYYQTLINQNPLPSQRN